MNKWKVYILTIGLQLMIVENSYCQRLIGESWQGYNFPLLTAYNVSPSTNSKISSIGYSNPANLAFKTRLAIGIQYQTRSEIKNTNVNLLYPEDRKSLPRSLGIVTSIKSIHIAAAYHQIYNYSFKARMGEIRTEAEPEGTGKYAYFGEHSHIDRYSLLFGTSISIEKIQSSLYFGVNVSYDEILFRQYIWNEHNRAVSHRINGSIGLKLIHNTALRFGAFYSPGYTEKFSTEAPVSEFNPLGRYEYVASLPASLTLGFSTPVISGVIISGDFEWRYWNDKYDDMENTSNFSVGITTEKWSIVDLGIGIISYNVPALPEGWIRVGVNPPIRDEAIYPFLSLSKNLSNTLSIGLMATSKVVDRKDYLDREILSIALEYKK